MHKREQHIDPPVLQHRNRHVVLALPQLSRRQLNRIGQLQIEVHESRGNGVATLMAHLESAGFRIFHQEENYRNLGLFEYAFIRNTWHPTMFA